MTPFASVAILEKLALLRIAFCKAPVFSKACWRRTSVRPSAAPVVELRLAGFGILLGMVERLKSLSARGQLLGRRAAGITFAPAWFAADSAYHGMFFSVR